MSARLRVSDCRLRRSHRRHCVGRHGRRRLLASSAQALKPHTAGFKGGGQGARAKPFIFYFSLVIDAYEATRLDLVVAHCFI